MYYVVCMHDKERSFYLGFSQDKHIAERYMEQRDNCDDRDDHNGFQYDIIIFSEKKFEEAQMKSNAIGACTEIEKYGKGIYLSEDDRDYVCSSLDEGIEDLMKMMENVAVGLSWFDDPEIKKVMKKIKKTRKRIKYLSNPDNAENIYDFIDWKKAIKLTGI